MNRRNSKLFRIGDVNVKVASFSRNTASIQPENKQAWLQAIGETLGTNIILSDQIFHTIISSSTGAAKIFKCKGTEMLNNLDTSCNKAESIRISIGENEAKKVYVILAED